MQDVKSAETATGHSNIISHNMSTVFYKKQGRRYIPVRQFDEEFRNSMPEGSHLLIVRPGSQSIRFNIEPALAPLIAAASTAEDAMSRAVYNAMELRPQPLKLTATQQKLVAELTASMNSCDARWLRSSSSDIARAGLEALQKAAEEKLAHPSVQDAYLHFLSVVALTKLYND